jgi:hypothetical protein
MIITISKLRVQTDCGELTDDIIQSRLDAIEQVIRKYTNNNFQNRNVRFVSSSSGDKLMGTSPFIRKGDTIQISQSMVNDGLYVVKEVTEDSLTVDRELFDFPSNKVTKIEYPQDVIQCALDLFEWKKNFGAKIGIKSESETLSRHSESVTYEDSATLFMGYPVGILKGLSLHKKARC